ncbi:hypothetical protein HYH03_013859 [Edaphochlamys debaryana]|uniref:C-type lectin domain-containing protein n=1 Tax=Edaphochlamys debaryana TaxID=47281 RepID=A0A835XVF6_9CHLO|nr:hypothetical protein HYH03_013859 [Edaphochlamys debaryana]|eukprot:KAG2487580.1 hypothetical protein HYH03_013859 [Edaphochlamys debaryana]
MDWPSAEQLCQAQGGHLAFFDAPAQFDAVVDVVSQYIRGNPSATWLTAWLGLNDRHITVPGLTTFGTTTPMVACPEGSFIRSMSARVDNRTSPASPSSPDLVGLMAMAFTCAVGNNGSVGNFTVGQDPPSLNIGTWGAAVSCNFAANDYALGIALKSAVLKDNITTTVTTACQLFLNGACVQYTSQSTVVTTSFGDDVGVTSARLACRFSGNLEIPNPGPDGTFQAAIMCDNGFVLCGVAVSSQPFVNATASQATSSSVDNTFVNALTIRCCSESFSNSRDCIESRFNMAPGSTTGTASWSDKVCTTRSTQAALSNVLCRRDLPDDASAQGTVQISSSAGVRDRGSGGSQAVLQPTVQNPLPQGVAQGVTPAISTRVAHTDVQTNNANAGSIEAFQQAQAAADCRFRGGVNCDPLPQSSAISTVLLVDEFLLFELPMQWPAAVSFCRAHSAELASIADAQQLQAVYNMVKSWAAGRFSNFIGLWFGASNAGAGQPWLYTTGDAVVFNAWGAGSATPTAASCAQLLFQVTSTGQLQAPEWTAINCAAYHRSFICKRPLSRRPAPIVLAPLASISPRSTRSSLFRQEVNWTQGGFLGSINDATEADFIAAMARDWAHNAHAGADLRLWLGARYSEDGPTGASWSWLDGSPFSFVRGGGILPSGPTAVGLCLSWLLPGAGNPTGPLVADSWVAVPCTDTARPLCQTDLLPFTCVQSTASAPPSGSGDDGSLYCPLGTVVTGVVGSLPVVAASVLPRAVSFAAVCGNPQAPAILEDRDLLEEVPFCRGGWSLPRQESSVLVPLPSSLTDPAARLDACAKACGVTDQKLMTVYTSQRLSVLYGDGACKCARALTGLQFSPEAVESTAFDASANASAPIFYFGLDLNITGICATSEPRITAGFVRNAQYQMGLSDLPWSPALTAVVRGSKYRLFSDIAADWETAQRVCTLFGGHLATLQASADLQLLVGLLGSALGLQPPLPRMAALRVTGGAAALWVGLYKSQSPGYRWVDGTPLAYSMVPASDSDAFDFNTNCGFLRLNVTSVGGSPRVTAVLTAGSCGSNDFYFVCETSTMIDDSLADLTPGVDTRVPPAVLPPASMGSWVITLHTTHAVGWRDAARICRATGKQLLWFLNDAEAAFVAGLAANASVAGLWTALVQDAGGSGRSAWRTDASAVSLSLSTWPLPRASSAPLTVDTAGSRACWQLQPGSGSGSGSADPMLLTDCGAPLAFACKALVAPFQALPVLPPGSGLAPSSPPPPPSPPPPSPPPAGAPTPDVTFEYNGLTYQFFSSTGLDWESARRSCRAIGSRLAEFPTTDDFHEVAELVWLAMKPKTTASLLPFWFGLTWVLTNPGGSAVNGPPEPTSEPPVGLQAIEFSSTVQGAHFTLYGSQVDWRIAKAVCEANGQVLVDWVNANEFNRVAQALTNWAFTTTTQARPT